MMISSRNSVSCSIIVSSEGGEYSDSGQKRTIPIIRSRIATRQPRTRFRYEGSVSRLCSRSDFTSTLTDPSLTFGHDDQRSVNQPADRRPSIPDPAAQDVPYHHALIISVTLQFCLNYQVP